MHSTRLFLLAAAFLMLAACHTGGSGTTPPSPTPGPPKLVRTVTRGITANAGLSQAVNGPDGRVWFTEVNVDQVAAVDATGTVTQYPMAIGSRPDAITSGPDGNLWVGGVGGLILKVSTSGSYVPYTIAGAKIGGITVGPDTNIWYTDYGNDIVGKISTAGVTTTYPAPVGATPKQIAVGSDGNLWVTDSSGSILRVSTVGVMTQYKAGITIGAHPQAIVSAPDSNLYFTEPFSSTTANDRLGQVTTAGLITEFVTLATNTFPNQITVGTDGNLYFTQFNIGYLGRAIVPSGRLLQTPFGIVNGSAIVNGPDGNLWVGGLQTIYMISY